MARRTGREDSATREALMNAVEDLMREEGYAALSARSIGARAGLNYQLVFYYFEKVENLLLETYRRRTRRLLARTEQALMSELPLHALWDASRDPAEAALSLEYMAMSNHVAVIREETLAHMERMLRVVLETTANHPLRVPSSDVFTPAAVAILVAIVGENMGYQSALGIVGQGMDEARTVVKWLLDRVEQGCAPFD